MGIGLVGVLLLLPLLTSAQERESPRQSGWTELFNGGNLEGWETIGEGVWIVMRGGTLLGQCDPRRPFLEQAWLYTRREFVEFDLQLEYWMPLGGNSGISIRDTSRGRYAVAGPEHDSKRNPSHVGYEIQLGSSTSQRYEFGVSGSVYLLHGAKPGVQRDGDWNTLGIESRNDLILVRINGEVVSQHPGLPERSKTGPIGLQLHNKNTIVMFRNIRLRALESRKNP